MDVQKLKDGRTQITCSQDEVDLIVGAASAAQDDAGEYVRGGWAAKDYGLEITKYLDTLRDRDRVIAALCGNEWTDDWAEYDQAAAPQAPPKEDRVG